MSFRQQLEKLGATPGKLALIGVLSIVLIVVIVQQLPDHNEAKTVAQNTTSSSQSKEVTTAPRADDTENPDPEEQSRELKPWPETNLAEALAKDPFALPPWAVPQQQDKPEDAGVLAELQEQGASIVVITSDYKSATVGDYKVHVGDILEGYRISDITSEGIVLDKLETR